MLFGLFGLQRPPFNGRVEAVYYIFVFLQHFVKSVLIIHFFVFLKIFHKNDNFARKVLQRSQFSKTRLKIHFNLPRQRRQNLIRVEVYAN